jgi:hypothetical protein
VRTLRKLVLGETWVLPGGVAVALAVVGALALVDGDDPWFHRAGGWILFGLLACALAVAVRR